MYKYVFVLIPAFLVWRFMFNTLIKLQITTFELISQQVKRSEWVTFVYLVEHRVVALPDASPLGLPGYRYLDDGLDVDAWQLAALDDPHTNLDGTRKTSFMTLNRKKLQK